MLRSSAIGACTLGAGAVLSACTGDRSWPDTGSDGGGASGGDPGAGKGAAPTVSARMIVSAASVLGVLLDVVDADGPSVAAVWYRAEGDRAVTSPALIRSEQWGELVERARDSARSVPGLDVEGTIAQLQEQPRPWGNGPAIIPDADGALRLLFPAAPYAKGHGEALVEVPAAHGATLLSELGKQIRAAIAEPDVFDPGQVTVPMPEDHHGEDSYDPDEPVTPAHPARETSSPGPRTQLAPLAEPGTAPSAVTAPDARRLRTVSLTFDDGPSPELNETLRSHLTARGPPRCSSSSGNRSRPPRSRAPQLPPTVMRSGGTPGPMPTCREPRMSVSKGRWTAPPG